MKYVKLYEDFMHMMSHFEPDESGDDKSIMLDQKSSEYWNYYWNKKANQMSVMSKDGQHHITVEDIFSENLADAIITATQDIDTSTKMKSVIDDTYVVATRKNITAVDESAHPIHDWEKLSPSEIIIKLTNWPAGRVAGDDKDFDEGIRLLAKKKGDLTTSQKQTIMDTLAKTEDKYKDKYLPLFMDTNEGLLVDIASGLETVVKAVGNFALDVATIDYQNFMKFCKVMHADLANIRAWKAEKLTDMEIKQYGGIGGYAINGRTAERNLTLSKEKDGYTLTYSDPAGNMDEARLVLDRKDAEHVFKLLGEALVK